jgi:hypothetical protein
MSVTQFTANEYVTRNNVNSRVTEINNDITAINNKFPVSVSNGGTGQTSLTSGEILLGNGTSGITSTATLPVSKGGTGQTSLNSGEILLGNGTDGISSTSYLSVSKGGTGATTVTDARNNLAVMTGEQLYYNASGSASTIALSSSIANYKAIEIFYMEDDYEGPWRDSLKIWNNESSSARATLSSMFARVYNSNNQVKIFAANIYLSGTSLTWGYAKMATFATGGTVSVADLAQYSSHKVYKVVGYKY